MATSTGTFSSLLNDIASQVEYILVREFGARKLNPKLAGMYAQMLVGMVALTGQWWLEVRKPKREEVAAHLVNLGWNGLRGLEAKPKLSLDTTVPLSRLGPRSATAPPTAPASACSAASLRGQHARAARRPAR